MLLLLSQCPSPWKIFLTTPLVLWKRSDTPIRGLGNYEDVAKYYDYDVFKIKAKFETSRDGPFKALMLAIIGENPLVTVDNFARVVEQKARRKDVAILLRDFDDKRSNISS